MAATKNEIYDTLMALNSMVATMDQKLVSLGLTAVGTNAKIEELNTKQNNTGMKVSSCENGIATLMGSVADVNNNIVSGSMLEEISGQMANMEKILTDVSATMLLLVQRINAVESKVNGLSVSVTSVPAPAVPTKPPFDPNNPLPLTPYMQALVQSGKLIDAIKAYREHTMNLCSNYAGLKEAKDVVETYKKEWDKTNLNVPGSPLSQQEKDVLSGFASIQNDYQTNTVTYIPVASKKEDKIAAIVLYRKRTGAGLKEAKEAVEAFMGSAAWVVLHQAAMLSGHQAC